MQYSEVARPPCRAASAQGGECLGDGLAHERQGCAVTGETAGIDSAPEEGRRDARDERGVVGEPSVHVSNPLDSEPTGREGRFERCQPGIRCLRQGRRLLPDADVGRGPAGHDAADAGKSEVGVAGHFAGDGGPTCRIVAEEDEGWLPGQAGEPGASRGQLITPDRHEDDIVVAAGIRHDGGFPAGVLTAEDIPGGKASSGDFIGPHPVAQHRDGVPRCREVRPVDGSDHARTHDEHLHDELPGSVISELFPQIPCSAASWCRPLAVDRRLA